MLVNKEVRFQHGRVLTKEMLAELYEYPRRYLNMLYSVSDNCIVLGLNLVEETDGLYLTKGIVRFAGDLYFLKENINLSAFLENEQSLLADNHGQYVLEIAPQEIFSEHSKEDITEQSLKLVVAKTHAPENILLLKFLWRNGNLPLPTVDLHHPLSPLHCFLQEERTYVNVAESPYVCVGGEAYHPLVLQAAKEYLHQKQSKTMYDFMLLMQLENNVVLPVKMVQTYVEAQGKPVSDDREALLKAFSKALVLQEKVTTNTFTRPMQPIVEKNSYPKTALFEEHVDNIRTDGPPINRKE